MDNFRTIVANLYSSEELDDCIKKVVPLQYREDFKQELFLILLEKPSEEIIRISETGKLLYYVVRIILNLSRHERNIFHKKYLETHTETTRGPEGEDTRAYPQKRTRSRIVYDEAVLNVQSPEDVTTLEDRKEREDMEDKIIAELNKGGWDPNLDVAAGDGVGFPFHERIVELVVMFGGIRKASRETGIPKSTVHRAMMKARNRLNDVR